MITISIDRGGTFTDVYARVNGEELAFKLLSVDPAYADAPTEGIRMVLEIATKATIPRGKLLNLSAVDSIRMGTTVATNALLERKGERCALAVTKGFKDILQLGQQARPDIFDLKVQKLGQLYDSVVEVNERVVHSNDRSGADSISDKFEVRVELNLAEVEVQLKQLLDQGISSLAIAFMHSYACPAHELEVAAVAKKLGFTNVSVSSQLQPMVKYVSRTNSAIADAYLSPIIHQYLLTIAQGFVGGIEALGSKLLFMQSDGGLSGAQQFSGLRAVLSGPAGGVVGYARTTYTGEQPVLGIDMGGTSTDVSRFDKTFEHVFETQTAQVIIQAPQLAIETVAAGGGSILNWRNGLYAVGPESAGAHPGPACYRKGGPLTVTDANLLLGRIDIRSFPHIFGPNENEPLDVEVVHTKFAMLAEQISRDTGAELSVETVAQGFHDVANETMCRPIRSLTEGKGHSTNSHVLASFGGAAGQHAVAVARTLGVSRVVIHKYSSLLSAFGIALADVVADVQLPVSCTLNGSSFSELQSRLDIVERDAREKLAHRIKDADGTEKIVVERFLNCRYAGSDSFMMIQVTDTADQCIDDFVAKHLQEFGFSLEREVLVGDVRARAVAATDIDLQELLPVDVHKNKQWSEPPAPKRLQRLYFGEWTNASLYNLEDIAPGTVVDGPAMLLDNTQTLVIEPGARAFVEKNHVVLESGVSHAGKTIDQAVDAAKSFIEGEEENEVIDTAQLSVFGHRFMSIAEQMGHTLQKTSISVNIKERLDFSCAIFNADGGLVANAPHIPVHLGSMSSAVEYQRQYWQGKLKDGDVLMANHPAYGGSHLPDITVSTPVFKPNTDEIIFWAASRGHHSDIGGITAGSMPPFSQWLWQEGACIQAHKIVSNGKFDYDGLVKLMCTDPAQYPHCSGSRSFSDCVSDLRAQIAANNKGIHLLRALSAEFTLPKVQRYMVAIQDNAEQTVRALLKRVAHKTGAPYRIGSRDHLDDGSLIQLSITIDPVTGSAEFDFSGTGPQLFGNLNAPRAITQSAILYCLRTMISQDIPLNQGCLTPLKIKIPNGTLLAPGPDAATVGGNVETSQRVTDVLFQSFGAVADSQGTCNNLTFGCEEFGYYETIGGGAGAGPGFHGQSGVQVHMTNTRSTDPEIFEKRYPVVLHEFALRKNSGGAGKWTGGDGIIREIEFRRNVQLSILSERRARAPHGMAGGQDASPGVNLWIRDGKVRFIGGKNTIQVEVGDRVLIQTPGGGGFGDPEPKNSDKPKAKSSSSLN